MHEALRQILQAEAKRPDEEIDILRMALLVARHAHAELDPAPYIDRLARWADKLANTLPEKADVSTRIARLNHFMFEELGFSAAQEDYYSSHNSYLNEVLDRRRGIPITLALIYMVLGRRIGLELEGVSFPGHFLVKLTVMGGQVVLDPYNKGASLDEDDLRLRLISQYGKAPATIQPLLYRASHREILVRMLRNLKGIYQMQGEVQRALEIIDLIIAIDPHLDEEYRDRGLFFYEVGYASAALRDLRHYLAAQPNAEDAAEIRDLIISLQQQGMHLH